VANLNWIRNFDYLFICLGPDHWQKLYPIANRDHQSPIKSKEVKKGVSLRLLQITWKCSICKEIVNVGHSFHRDFEDKDNQSG
uniref:Alpha-carbonic anhydrase domain-containing protein n=1 Tax=Strigops habroptila TaxID=2489341 RepID=A0A672TYA3_STRHB